MAIPTFSFSNLLTQASAGDVQAIELLLFQVLANRLNAEQIGRLKGRLVKTQDSSEQFITIFQAVIDLQDKAIDRTTCITRLGNVKTTEILKSDALALFKATVASLEPNAEHEELCTKILNDETASPIVRQLVKLPLASACAHQTSKIDPLPHLREVSELKDVIPGLQAQALLYYAQLLEALDPPDQNQNEKAMKQYQKIHDLKSVPASLKAEAKFRYAELLHSMAMHDEKLAHLNPNALSLYEEVFGDQNSSVMFVAVAKIHYARILRLGKGVMRDHNEALKRYLEALEYPNLNRKYKIEAKYGCIIIYSESKDGVKPNPKRVLEWGREIIKETPKSKMRLTALRYCAPLCEQDYPEEAFNYYKEYLQENRQDDPDDLFDPAAKLVILAGRLRRYHDACFYQRSDPQPRMRSDLLSFVPIDEYEEAHAIAGYHYIIKCQELTVLTELQKRFKLPYYEKIKHLTMERFLHYTFCTDYTQYTTQKHKFIIAIMNHCSSFASFISPRLEDSENAGALMYTKAYQLCEILKQSDEENLLMETQAYRLLREVPPCSTSRAVAYNTLTSLLFLKFKGTLSPREIFDKIKPIFLEAQNYQLDLEMGRYPLDRLSNGAHQTALAILQKIRVKADCLLRNEPLPETPDRKRKDRED